jgi:hypothetical protein
MPSRKWQCRIEESIRYFIPVPAIHYSLDILLKWLNNDV